MKKIILIIFLGCLFAQIALAENEIIIGNPVEVGTFNELVDTVINFVFLAAIVITPIMFIIAGIQMVTAGGDSKKVDTAKKIMLYTVVGLIVVMFSRGIIAVVKKIIGG